MSIIGWMLRANNWSISSRRQSAAALCSAGG
jgi:hypothetical protein